MAQWVDVEAEKSRTERMSVRDQPTWDWFVGPHQESQKAWEKRVIFIF